jgi:hypothetical protein
LQLAPNQSDWDLLLPVYTGDINKPIERDHLSAIFVQIKNRQKPQKLTLGSAYCRFFHPGQLGFCIQMEFGVPQREALAQMRWPTRTRPYDSTESGRFVFGMQVFGAGGGTFPFLTKYPNLAKACGNLVRTLSTNSEYPKEPPALEALNGFDSGEPSGGTSGGGMGGHGGDDDGEGVEDDDEDDTEDDYEDDTEDDSEDDTKDGGGDGMDDDEDDTEDDYEDDTEDGGGDGMDDDEDDIDGWIDEDSPMSGMA